jgi:hypothetical protein
VPEVVQLLREAAELQRRSVAGAEAHAIAVQRQQRLKSRAPKVIIRGLQT